MCVIERERERDRERQKDRETERQRQRDHLKKRIQLGSNACPPACESDAIATTPGNPYI